MTMTANALSADLSRILPYVQINDNGSHSLNLSVDGIYCAACIQKIESGLKKIPGVSYVRLNFTTRRLNVSWNGARETGDDIGHVIADLGYKATAYDPAMMAKESDSEAKNLLLCLGVAGFAAGNIMLMSFALWTTDIETMGVGVRDFLHWVSALVAIPAIAFSGRPFFLSALKALRAGRTNMDVPISVGLILTTGMSLFELVSHGEHAYFDSAVMLMFFLLIGRYLDYMARASARRAATDLLSLLSGTAMQVTAAGGKNILIRDVLAGMTLSVGMGEHFPVDGMISKGRTEIDTSLVTGESIPVSAGEGDEVLAGTLNLNMPVQIQALRGAEESQIGGMVRLMERAEQSQALYVRIADRVARLYTPVVHILALATFIYWVWMAGQAWQPSLLTAATVLIITCPCALALAVPIVQVLAIGRLMKHGIMVRAGDVLERIATVDTVIFDKTGTLTIGKPVLQASETLDPEAFRVAASMAVNSRHPLSRSIAASYQGELVSLAPEEIPGCGLIATLDGASEYRLGSRVWAAPHSQSGAANVMEVVLSKNGSELASFKFRDELRKDAKDTIQALQRRGLKLYLLSGDRQEIVDETGRQLGIPDIRSGMKPEDKYNFMQELRRQGHKVMMVGDGMNDAPTLAGADVSVSPSSAIDLARNSSSVVFTGEMLSPLLRLIQTGVRSQTLVHQNFGMTFIYNLVAIPMAVAGYVTPLIAAAAMSLSSLAVILNAFRIRRRA